MTVREKAEAPEGKDTLQTRQTTIGKGKQDIRDIPQSISVMTEKLIDDRKLDTLKEALHHTAGITFAATENGTDQDIRLRGFPVATVGDLLIDGMRDPSQYDRDTFNYDRIEIMRGAASMVFGRGSTGGVINQVTKQPMLADQNDFETTIGSRGYLRTTADFNLRTGEEAALRLNVMYNGANNGKPLSLEHGSSREDAHPGGNEQERQVAQQFVARCLNCVEQRRAQDKRAEQQHHPDHRTGDGQVQRIRDAMTRLPTRSEPEHQP